MPVLKTSLFEDWANHIPKFNSDIKSLFLESHFDNSLFPKPDRNIQKGAIELGLAIEYSLFTGGKRFRPLLTFASCQVLNQDFEIALPWAMAIECVHTYSLIHDDLPSMDNDDERRGQPTVHKKFNEATALLAGDALLTEAFGLLGKAYGGHKNLGLLVQLLSQRAGYQGMVSGQANDLFVNKIMIKSNETKNSYPKVNGHSLIDKEQILFIHLQKTAALINAASMGPLFIFDIDKISLAKFNTFSLILGILFQLKDDVLDSEIKLENNLVQLLGLSETKKIYNDFKTDAEKILNELSTSWNVKPYQELIDYNETRKL